MNITKQMEQSLGIDSEYIENIAKRNHLYAMFYIKKKNGKSRKVFQPSRELKVLQRWLVDNILLKYPISDCSVAYSKGDNIQNNANMHTNSNYLLHMDIKNFFPSITRTTLSNFFVKNHEITNSLNLMENDIRLILDICLFKGEYLVIGSPASPQIANRVMYDFDTKICSILNKSDIKYTRYSDDLIFSSKNYLSESLAIQVEELLNNNGFSINKEKTYYMNKKGKRYITGVVLDNNVQRLSIGNKKYKEFQRKLYNYLIKNEGDVAYIIGYLAYIKGINQGQYEQIKKIYQRYDKRQLIFERDY